MSKFSAAQTDLAGNARAAAAKAICRIVYDGVSLNRTLESVFTGFSERDRYLIADIVNGVVRHFWRLEAYVGQLLKRSPKQKDRDIFCLVLVGVYQIEYMRVPDYAAVSESVDAVSVLGKPWARKLVNAVLRGFLARRDEIVEATMSDEARYCHPEWMIRRLKEEWPDDWIKIAQANNQKPAMTLRVNSKHHLVGEYLELLSEAGIEAIADSVSPLGVVLKDRIPVAGLPGFSRGAVSVQNSASQLAVPLLDIQPGHRVLDACSAPGGKLLHMLETSSNTGQIVALDISETRCSEIVDNLGRVGESATVIAADATKPDTWWDGQLFDRILLDAPCSAFGVIQKHPEIKIHRRPADIINSSSLQKKMLAALLELLADGGKLLYTTCSILAAENDDVIAGAIEARPDVQIQELKEYLGRPTRFGRQRLQGIDASDGFYYALLAKSC